MGTQKKTNGEAQRYNITGERRRRRMVKPRDITGERRRRRMVKPRDTAGEGRRSIRMVNTRDIAGNAEEGEEW